MVQAAELLLQERTPRAVAISRPRAEEVQVAPGSALVGQALRDAPIRREMDVIVVGVRAHQGGMQFNPPPDLRLASGDTLVVLGHRENLRRLARLSQA